MQLPWRRKQAMLDAASQINTHAKTEAPERVLEEAPVPRPKQKAYETWVDQMIADHEQQGGFKDLQGKGKPLHLDDSGGGEYIVNKIMKNANILPPWLELQHEIRDDLQALIKRVASNPEANIQSAIQAMNEKIHRFNSIVPSPLLYKPTIQEDRLYEQLESWM